MCQYFYLFVLQVIFFVGLLSCKNCTSVLYSVDAYYFFYGFLTIYNLFH